MSTAIQLVTPVSNDAEEPLSFLQPYTVAATVVGTAPFLFHRWSVEAVDEKAKAAKGSKMKKTDNIESYVYRTTDGTLAIPGEYFRMAICNSARFRQDPRSPRKSAYDLFKAGVTVIEELCPLNVKDWDFIDRRRVMVQRQGITRSRPGLATGWTCSVLLTVLLPEYIQPELLNDVIQCAGRLIGVGDFRPSYGRFQVVGFETI